MDFKLAAWNIRGMSKELRQNDAKKFIQEEKVNMCAFIETHLKTKNIMKVGNKVFGDWEMGLLIQQTPSSVEINGSQRKTKEYAEFKDTLTSFELKTYKCQTAYGIFLPYMVSDHSPAVLHIKNGFPKKKSSLSVQAQVDKDPHDEKLRKEAASTLNEFVEASKDEMKMLKQKAKIKWLNEEDKNIVVFHGILKSRRSKSIVDFIKDEAGISYEGDVVNDQFVKHFEKFFGKVDHTSSIDESIFKKSLSNEEAKSVIGDVTDKEIKEAMFDIDSNKASGPDGFTSEFFKKAWDIIGMDVCLAIKEFFYNSKLLGEVNSTLIALIPKVSTPNKVSEFRPISCCNVIYKCISKILTNRIKGGLNKTSRRHMTLSTSFSICLNGETHGYFKGGRGLRQGDLMSPYLFTLVMEVFSLIMEKNIEESNGFGYHFGCKELKLSHMCFADDLLVLCKGNKDSIEVIKKSLEEFSKASGLVPNLFRYLGVPLLAKKLGVSDCKVLCDKVEERINNWRNKTLSYAGRIQLIASVLSSMQQYWASVYLLPTTVINDLEKLFKRFLWNAGDSARGKARVSWKVVCRPKDQVKNSLWAKWVSIVKLKNRSIWDVNIDKSDSWGWKSMLKIRDDIKNHVWYDIGDGRRDIYDARLDENAKVSDMISNNQWNWPNGWKEKYALLNNLDGVDVLIPRLFKNESRSEDVLTNLIYDSVRSKLMTMRVKKTSRTDVIANKYSWGLNLSENRIFTPGTSDALYKASRPKDVILGLDISIRDIELEVIRLIGYLLVLICVRDGIESQQMTELKSMLNMVSLSNSRDRWRFDLTGDGEFRVKEVRNFIDDLFLPSFDATRWVKCIPIKINIFVWRARRDCLPTRVNLARRGVYIESNSCPTCRTCEEDIHHSLFQCDLAQSVLHRICRWWDFPPNSWTSFMEWQSWFSSVRLASKVKILLEGVFYIAWWAIWSFRNRLIF
ncbi:RNA-directed DNA polymerase, eukaryota, reverse transcriptase zinc-binding domain protein [Tanacetum coccineum]